MTKAHTTIRGHSGLDLSRLAFGTSSLGGISGPIGEEDSQAVLDAARDAGLTYFDTAPYYGFGLAEQRLGSFLATQPRGSLVISTKVGRVLDPLDEGEPPAPGAFSSALPFKPHFDYSYDGIMRSYASSLDRLGGWTPDILYVHDIGARKHGDEQNAHHYRELMDGGMRALAELKSSGDVQAIGLGVNETDICIQMIRDADIDIILLANRYTLIERQPEDVLLPLCIERGVDVVIGGVFNSGILAKGPTKGGTFDYRPAQQGVLELVGKLDDLCRDHAIELIDAALNFPLRSQAVTSVLIGTSRTTSLRACVTKFGQPIPEAFWADAKSLVDSHTARAQAG